MQVTAPENLRDAAYEYCCSAHAKGTSFFTIANKLTKLGVPRHRAKRMARRVVKHGQFMWEGKLTPLKREYLEREQRRLGLPPLSSKEDERDDSQEC